MKLNVTAQELDDLNSLVKKTMVQGAAIGLGVSTIGNFVGNRYSTVWRSMRPQYKGVVISFVSIAITMTMVERRVLHFDRSRHDSEYGSKYSEVERRYEFLPFTDRAKLWLAENRYYATGGVMATVLGSSLWYNWSNPLIDRQQKFVNARMFTQTATLGSILALVFLASFSPRKEEKEKYDRDHWLRVVEQTEKGEAVPTVRSPAPQTGSVLWNPEPKRS